MKSMAHKRQERSRRFDAKSRFRRWKEEGHWKTLLWSVLAGRESGRDPCRPRLRQFVLDAAVADPSAARTPGDVCEVAAETAYAASPGISGASAVADDLPAGWLFHGKCLPCLPERAGKSVSFRKAPDCPAAAEDRPWHRASSRSGADVHGVCRGDEDRGDL